MKPVLTFDLSGYLIHDLAEYNLTAAVQSLDGDDASARREFPRLFDLLATNVAPLPDDEFWTLLAVAADIAKKPDALRTAFMREFDYRPGCRDLLADLKTMRVPAYVWTNIPNTWLDAIDRKLGLEELVSGIVNGRNIHWRKPEPGFFQAALDRHGLSADQIVYIGARRDNLEAAAGYSHIQWHTPPPERVVTLVRRLLRVDAPTSSLPSGILADW